MAKRKTKAKETKLQALGRIGAQGVVALSRTMPLVLLLVLAGVGVVESWKYAMADPRFRIAGDTLSLANRERFCAEAVEEVERLGRKAAGRSLLDPFLLSDLRKAYTQSPWVKRVSSMHRVFPNRLAVEFVLRRPLAQVRSGSFYWVVDSEGILLPVKGTLTPKKDLPEIVGAGIGAIGRHPNAQGAPWQDPGVVDAIGVLKTLRSSPLSSEFQIKRIVVHGGSFLNRFRRQVRKRPRLDIETDANVTIRWGTFNNGDFPDEMLSSEKISMLRNLVMRDFASIPGVWLDVHTRVPGFTLPRK